ncbi:MAG: Lrp/AsnC family transcriptional regulator [archaeon]|nr:Lrp/AsnC family transcriptional regulator [archaeon]
MDSIDLKIIEALKENSRDSIKKIAKKTGIPLTTIHYRLKNIMAANAINFTARVDRKFVNRELVAYVLVKAMPGVQHEKLLDEIIIRTEVESGAIVTGDFDLIFLVSVKNMDMLNQLVLHFLRTKKDVAETRTMICYNIKEK